MTGLADRYGRILLTLLIGCVAGLCALYLRVPLPWMLGPLWATMVIGLAGGNLTVERSWRDAMLTVLGVLIGSAFTPDVPSRLLGWLPSMLALVPFVAACGLLLAAALRRLVGYDHVTAWFAAMPGGLTEMVMIGRALGGDDRTLTLIHSVRIMVVVMLVPFGFTLIGEYHRPAPSISTSFPPLQDLALLLGCAVIGVPLGRKLRLPAPDMFGPMVLSAALHLTAVSVVKPPYLVVALAQVIVGASLGVRFVGYQISSALKTVAVGAVMTLAMFVLVGLFVVPLHLLTGIRLEPLVLSYAPGGVAELSLIALFLGIDAAFVSVHHLARIIVVVMVGPQLFRLVEGRRKGKRDAP